MKQGECKCEGSNMKKLILTVCIVLFVCGTVQARVTDPLKIAWDHVTDDDVSGFDIWCQKGTGSVVSVVNVTDETLRYIEVPGVDMPGGINDCYVTAIYADGETIDSGPKVFKNRGKPVLLQISK